jgi:hypothetical protein
MPYVSLECQCKKFTGKSHDELDRHSQKVGHSHGPLEKVAEVEISPGKE